MRALATLQRELIEAFNQGHWPATIRCAEALLKQVADHPGAHYLAGLAQLETGNIARALAHLHTAAKAVPDRADVLTGYARGLAEAQLNDAALQAVEAALRLRPADVGILMTLALVLSRMQLHDRAAPLYSRAVALRQDDPMLRHHLAVALLFGGEMEAAEREIDRCLQLDPKQWVAYDTRAQLRRQDADHNHVDELHALLAENKNDLKAVSSLSMALSRECEDLGRTAEAFTCLDRVKTADGKAAAYDAAEDEAMFSALMKYVPVKGPGMASHPPSAAPIFVVGMPRSGTTLVAQILDCHPQVHGAGELDQFANALKRSTGVQTPAPLDLPTIRAAQALEWQALGDKYLHMTKHAQASEAWFVDKLPHNFLYLGYIVNALPQSPILCLRRHPMDVCLGNFRQRFGGRSPLHGYSHNLLDIGRYYIQFDRLMKFWKMQYPGRILEISYERLVDQQETVTREALAFCGLDWDPACLHFERNPSAVGTASAAQVRAPMNRSSLGRWKRYAAQLQPLRELLEAGGIEIND